MAGIGQAINQAYGAGQLDAETAGKLEDKLLEVAKELDKPGGNPDQRSEKVREKAEDLREEIDDLAEDGELPPELAVDLRDRLAALSA